MDRRIVFVVVLGAAVMAVTGWKTYPRDERQSLADTSKFRYMYCPNCKREQMFDQAKFENPCPYCDKRLIGTEQSIKQGGGPPNNPYGKMFIFMYAELVGLMAVVWFLTRPGTGRQPDEDFLYFNCEHCGQKIRYRDAQVGQPAMCRRCKRPFLYPPEATGDG